MSTYSKASGNLHNAVFLTGEAFVRPREAGDAFRTVSVVEQDGKLCLSGHLDVASPLFHDAWEICKASFPREERRGRLEQEWAMRNPHYRFSAIMLAGRVVGVIGLWEMNGFCYIEHLAVSSAVRSQGIGGRLLRMVEGALGGLVLLDVEPFGSTLQASRRVAFYVRQGYHYCSKSVLIPAFAGQRDEATNFMSWPRALSPAERSIALEAIKRRIYGIPSAYPVFHAG